MIDPGKRTTLKKFAGLAAGAVTAYGASGVALGDSGASANGADTVQLTPTAPNGVGPKTDVTGHGGVEIYFSPASDGPDQMVSIGNAGSTEAPVRHVYPGVVQVGAHRYDINAALAESPLTLAPGHRKTLRLLPMRADQIAQDIPRGLTHSRPVAVTSAYSAMDSRRFVTTTRSVFG